MLRLGDQSSFILRAAVQGARKGKDAPMSQMKHRCAEGCGLQENTQQSSRAHGGPGSRISLGLSRESQAAVPKLLRCSKEVARPSLSPLTGADPGSGSVSYLPTCSGLVRVQVLCPQHPLDRDGVLCSPANPAKLMEDLAEGGAQPPGPAALGGDRSGVKKGRYREGTEVPLCPLK